MSPASPGCQQKTGDLQRRFESGLGTILMWIVPVPKLHTVERHYPGCVWDGWSHQVFNALLGPNSPKSCSQPQAG